MSMAAARRHAPEGAAPEVEVNMVDMRGALAAVDRKASVREGFTLFTVNLDHVVKLNDSHNRPFREAYERADFVTADGWPIVWLIQQQARRQNAHAQAPGGVERRSLERTTGADLLEPLCKLAAERGYPLYFIGPGPASQKAGLEVLSSRYPGLIVAGAEAPQLPAVLDEATIEALAARINATEARVCVVSLGAPKQEVLADALFSRCPRVGFLCVGAALDFISGHARRAPGWVRKARMEWFWRMVGDPKRLAGRYVSCAVALIKLSCPAIFRRDARLRLADHND